MLQGKIYLATIFKNGSGTKPGHAPYQQNINKRYFYLFEAGKQTIASPLNKDHRATHTTKVKYLYHRNNL